jgi:hypothetical protein
MAFKKCETPPAATDLAISKPNNALAHLPAIDAQHRYWARRQFNAVQNVDLTTHALAIALHREFSDFNESVLLQAAGVQDPWYIERDRRRVLGTLALSRLFRLMLQAPTTSGKVPTPLDAKAYKFSNFLGDMMTGEDGMPLDHRLHMMKEHVDGVLPPEEGVDEQWYQQGGLYVRRTTKADPSDPIIPWLQKHEIEVPFDQMTTLYPAVASVT